MTFRAILTVIALTVAPFWAHAVTISVNTYNSSNILTGNASGTNVLNANVDGWNMILTGGSVTTATTANLLTTTINLNSSATSGSYAQVTFTDSYSILAAKTVFDTWASVTNAMLNIVVQHQVSFDNGATWASLGSLNFGSSTGLQSSLSNLSSTGTFLLQSVFTITTNGVDGIANIQGNIQANAVPLPAAALMLLTGLGGMAALRRRRKT